MREHQNGNIKPREVHDSGLYPSRDTRMRKEQDYSDDIGVYNEGYADNMPRNAAYDHGNPRPHQGYNQVRVEKYSHTQDREASRYSNQGRFGVMGSDPVKNTDDPDIHKEAVSRNADDSRLRDLPFSFTRH